MNSKNSTDPPRRNPPASRGQTRPNAPDTPELAERRAQHPTAQALVTSGDEIADREGRARFVREYQEAHRLVSVGEGKVTLTVGAREWPLPIPIVKDAAGWWFDTAVGREEILNRRIGRNELSAIQVCLAYVDAQREYYIRDPDKDALLAYAQRLGSRPGKRDGLYWETQPGDSNFSSRPIVDFTH